MKKLTSAQMKRFSTASDKKRVLHLFSGAAREKRLHVQFTADAWEEIRVDPQHANAPDILGGFDTLALLPNACVEAVWFSQRLQSLNATEVVEVLKQIPRVLRDDGMILLNTVEVQTIAKYLWEGRALDEPLARLPGGATLSPLELLYGSMRMGVESRTIFTTATLGKAFKAAGFSNIEIKREEWLLWGLAYKIGATSTIVRNDKIVLFDKFVPPQPTGTSGQLDELDRPPYRWKALGLKR